MNEKDSGSGGFSMLRTRPNTIIRGEVQGEYIVRGAKIKCSRGDGYDVVNLPLCHGVYSGKEPLINVKDMETHKNIVNGFGVCTTPEGKKICKEEMKFTYNWINRKKIRFHIDGEQAVTTNSFTMCSKHGGEITFIDSGQTATYTPRAKEPFFTLEDNSPYLIKDDDGDVVSTSDDNSHISFSVMGTVYDSNKDYLKYVEKEDNNSTIASIQLNNSDFVKIFDGSDEYFGGDQAWYKPNEIGESGGCGPTAASNILAYMASNNSNLANLYQYDLNNINKNDFSKHMNEVYNYITPIKVPEILAEKEIGDLTIPITLGVPTLSQFADGVEAFAKDRDIELKALWVIKPPTIDNAIEYIISGLEKNSPIALLNYSNSKLSSVPFTNHENNVRNLDFQMHWVTITSIDGLDTDNPTITVSSWGGYAILNLKDVVNNAGFGGLLYFE